jgi:tetratricopeptide (TPR) repeat protein
MQKKLDEAMRYQERALAIMENVLGADHVNIGLTTNNLGDLARQRGDCKTGVQHLTRSLSILEKLGPTHPYVAMPLINRAHCLVDLGQHREAVTDGERAMAILASHEGDPAQLAEAKFATAKGLWETDRKRARTLATEAAKTFEAAGPAGAAMLAEIVAWREKH